MVHALKAMVHLHADKPLDDPSVIGDNNSAVMPTPSFAQWDYQLTYPFCPECHEDWRESQYDDRTMLEEQQQEAKDEPQPIEDVYWYLFAMA